jgi:hypothetical protein
MQSYGRAAGSIKALRSANEVFNDKLNEFKRRTAFEAKRHALRERHPLHPYYDYYDNTSAALVKRNKKKKKKKTVRFAE